MPTAKLETGVLYRDDNLHRLAVLPDASVDLPEIPAAPEAPQAPSEMAVGQAWATALPAQTTAPPAPGADELRP